MLIREMTNTAMWLDTSRYRPEAFDPFGLSAEQWDHFGMISSI